MTSLVDHDLVAPQLATADDAFWLGPNRRAMVSLGPVKEANYCTFSCPFCYVQGPFPRYQRNAAVRDIVQWLTERRSEYDVVYISGDTDSFAAPRTSVALDLLTHLLALRVDVLFTTRHLFQPTERARLAQIATEYGREGTKLIGCVSVSQLRQPSLEPPPIASPEDRIRQLGWFRRIGIVSVLTIRPFIPAVPAEEYAAIARDGIASCDVVLGSDWYVDPGYEILRRTEAALGRPVGDAAAVRALDFAPGDEPWIVYSHPAAEAAGAAVCAAHDRAFFMRSDPAIDYVRSLAR